MKGFVVCALLLPFFDQSVAEEAPRAPALEKSHWPIAHASTWNSDYTGQVGPKRGAVPQLLINGEDVSDIADIFKAADPITLVQSSVVGYAWGSSISSVFQTFTNESGAQLINTYFRDFNFEYHGAYCLLAADGTYYAATRNSIQAYNNEKPYDFTTPIVSTGEYFAAGLEDDEHIVGLTVTHDDFENAYLIFATSFGAVGGVSMDFKRTTNLFRIPGIETVSMPDHFVSNSIGMDGPSGGIYVCTSYSMTRLKWDPSKSEISMDWNTPYGDGQDEWYWGRLGPGCGTSPTIVGPSGSPEYVTITDGESPMNILFFDVHSGALAGKHRVSFGNTQEQFNSTTDQSIVVKGYRAVVVNNWVADVVTPFCSEFFSSLDFVTEALKHECPFLFGSYVNGVEQFEIDPKSGAVNSVWSNPDVSCTSSIPVVSEDNVLYCLGKRTVRNRLRPTYTIEAMDWFSGRSLFFVETTPSLLANSLYAATEIGSNADIVMGALSGILRVAAAPSNSPTNNSTTSPLDELAQSNKWIALDKLADWNAQGLIPTRDMLASLGLRWKQH